VEKNIAKAFTPVLTSSEAKKLIISEAKWSRRRERRGRGRR
jgi:hypothetical protein